MPSARVHDVPTPAELVELRAELRDKAPSTADIERHYRRIVESTRAAVSQDADLKVAWLGNHTLDPALRWATVAAFAHDVTLANYLGGFGQHFQAVLDTCSPLHEYAPDAIVLWLSLRAMAPRLVSGGAGRTEAERQREADRVLERVEQWVEAAKTTLHANLIVCNFPRPPSAALGLTDLRSPAGDAALFASLNGRLSAAYRHDPQVHVLDIDHAMACAGSGSSWDPQMYYLADIEWTGPALSAAAERIARALCALTRPAKKCLVLDLDNTLWGGVVGEDGVDGIRIGSDEPVARAYLAFQRSLLDIKARGVLLALASKNNAADVDEAFARLDMPLEPDHFAAKRIDWRPKHVNIGEIADELNIGLDSIVFVDDDPAQCELIRQLLPEVEVLALPDDPADYAAAIETQWYFDKLLLTEEDTRKTEQYLENAERAASRASAADLGTYLESLGTRVEFKPAHVDILPRLHQLFGKTNQFNLTSKRYGLNEIGRFIDSDEWLFEAVRVRDNFGDLGLVGLYLVRLGAREAEVDSFVLSCRALGRQVECAMCNRIKARIFASGAAALRACYAPTRRNAPAAQFYESQGFVVTGRGPADEKFYCFTASDMQSVPEPETAITEDTA